MKESVAVQNYHYLLHPYNTSLVTCCDAEGWANIITIAWLIPMSGQPPLVGMSIRPSLHLGRNHSTTTVIESVEPHLDAPVGGG